MSFTLSKNMRQATITHGTSRSGSMSRKAVSVRCLALPDAKVIARKALLGAGAFATALSLTMSAQAFELPFFNKTPAEKLSNNANDIKSKVQTSTSSAAEQMKNSGGDAASKVSNASNFPGQLPNSVKNTASDVKTNAGDSANSLQSQAKDTANKLGSSLQSAAQSVSNNTSSNPTTPANSGTDLNSETSRKASDAKRAVSDLTEKAKSAASTVSDKVQQGVKGTDVAYVSGISEAAEDAAAAAKSKRENAVESFSQAASGITGKVQGAVSGSAVDEAASKVEAARNSATDSANQIQSKVGDAVDGAKLQLPELGKFGADVTNKVQQGIKQNDVASISGISDAAGDASAAAKGSADKAVGSISNAASGIAGRVQTAVSGGPMGEAASNVKDASNSASKVDPAGDNYTRDAASQYQRATEGNMNKVGEVKEEVPLDMQLPDLGNLGSDISDKVQEAGQKLGVALSP